jgi:gamma-glutamylputrescine oxidase
LVLNGPLYKQLQIWFNFDLRFLQISRKLSNNPYKLPDIDQLSFWERNTYFENIDFLIVGAGIVGFSTAIELRKKHSSAKVVILERGYLPSGASTKNAGFACFGSVTEILDDLQNMNESVVWNTVEKRWKGLQNLRSLVGDDSMELQTNGSWDLIRESDTTDLRSLAEKLDYLNYNIRVITGEKEVYSFDPHCAENFGFGGIKGSFKNRLEGQIHTGKLITKLHQLATELGVHFLFGIEVIALQSNLYHCSLQTSIGFFKAKQVLVCTNGFASQLLPHLKVKPARAQVLVTTPIQNLRVKGTFHYQQGYYYFRNIEDRILLGGGRNLDFEGETTTELTTTTHIVDALKNLLREVILPRDHFDIAYQWSGIMGVGPVKAPIVERLDERISIGVRMGGMGVAIGSLIGKELAELFD